MRDAFAVFALFLVAVAIAYLRNPIAVLEPTMYAEDGSWMASLYTRGALQTYLHARADYLVVANIAMLHLASLISEAAGGGIIGTPPVIAALSYVFFGCVAVLPAIALRDELPLSARAFCVVLVAMVPVGLPQSSAEIWGRAVNIGFAFSFIAVLAAIWRERLLRRGVRWSVAPDVLIVLSCATNPIAFPIIGLYFGHQLATEGWRTLKRDAYLLLPLGVLGVLTAWGVLTSTRPPSETSVELTLSGLLLSGVARPLLYPFLFPVYDRLSDGWALFAALILASFLLVALWAARRKSAYGFLLVSLALVTLAIAIQRPHLPLHLNGYAGTFPDRYFYAQNITVLTAVVWAAFLLHQRFPRSLVPLAIPICLAVLFLLQASQILLPGQAACPEIGTAFADQVAAGRPIPGRPDVIAVEICPPTWIIAFPASEAP